MQKKNVRGFLSSSLTVSVGSTSLVEQENPS